MTVAVAIYVAAVRFGVQAVDVEVGVVEGVVHLQPELASLPSR